MKNYRAFNKCVWIIFLESVTLKILFIVVKPKTKNVLKLQSLDVVAASVFFGFFPLGFYLLIRPVTHLLY